MEMYDKYQIIKPPYLKVPANKLTVIFAFTMIGILSFAIIVGLIGYVWEIYFKH